MLRRDYITVGCTAGIIALAGCTSDSETEEEFEEIADNVESHFEEAERLVDSGVRNLERDEYGQCAADMEGAENEIDNAQREIRRGLRRAEDAGYLDEADALDFLSEYIELVNLAVNELMLFCDAMREDDFGAAETHAENAENYVEEYEQMESDVERAIEELED